LVTGTAIKIDGPSLLTFGLPVNGIAADSAARVVLLIPANSSSDTFTVTVSDDQNSQDFASLGGLYAIGGNDSTTDSQLTVGANYTDSQGNAWAFAVYRAPNNYVRGGAAPVGDDFASTSRSVQFQAVATSGYEVDGSLAVVRPPVVLVHGLWGSSNLWKGFLSDGNIDNRFMVVEKVNYYIRMRGAFSVDSDADCGYPGCSTSGELARHANANELGLKFNAPTVMQKIQDAIVDLRNHAIAAAQADVVAHSMGGLLTRQAESLPAFADGYSFGVGNIHKLITVGTPHFGSIFATLLLQDPCMAYFRSQNEKLVLGQNVHVVGRGTFSVGAFDTEGDANGMGQGLTGALTALNNGSGHGVPAHMLAGAMTSANFASYAVGYKLAMAYCTFLYPFSHTPLANGMRSYNSWRGLFNGSDSDSIVAVSSQLFGQSGGGAADVYSGLIHDPGMTVQVWIPNLNVWVNVGLTGPAETQQVDPTLNPIPTRIIDLLQEPISGTNLFQPIPQ
jgi:pimeloyl-ACP methyl ester carboxylesterase